MKRAVWAALRQAFCGYGFAAGVLGTAAVLLAASFEGVLEAYRAGELAPGGPRGRAFDPAVSSDAMALSLPLLCTLPYTASFLDDVKSGFIKAYLPRTSVSRYIAGKAAACALSGGMALSGRRAVRPARAVARAAAAHGAHGRGGGAGGPSSPRCC